ncbi:hypothetical protein B0H14DRAFT_266558 [Mycena olivaceomarginata]|nr:hypothetical protein B0H14DRAFT_266558 [Mycena olivaceomarginata]
MRGSDGIQRVGCLERRSRRHILLDASHARPLLSFRDPPFSIPHTHNPPESPRGHARGVRDGGRGLNSEDGGRGRDDVHVGQARGGLACAPSLPVRAAHPPRMLGLRRLCSPPSHAFIASARDAAGPSVMRDLLCHRLSRRSQRLKLVVTGCGLCSASSPRACSSYRAPLTLVVRDRCERSDRQERWGGGGRARGKKDRTGSEVRTRTGGSSRTWREMQGEGSVRGVQPRRRWVVRHEPRRGWRVRGKEGRRKGTSMDGWGCVRANAWRDFEGAVTDLESGAVD